MYSKWHNFGHNLNTGGDSPMGKPVALSQEEAEKTLDLITDEMEEVVLLARAISEMELNEEDRHVISRMIRRSAKRASEAAIEALDL